MRNWLRALWSWLWEASHFWLAIVVVGMALLFVLRHSVSEPEIRITGLFLQILGIGTVAWGIRETRMLFGRPDIISISRGWLKRFPTYGGRIVSGSLNITLDDVTVQARGYVSASAGPEATAEARIEALEKNVKYLSERIDHTQSEIDQNFRTQVQKLDQEQQTRAKEDQDIRAKLEVTETGGLHISAMGALWLFVGVTLSTASTELAKWFS
jgi:hypothetical protein